MHTRFTASQSVEIAVPKQPIPIQHYLRQPQRLVNALVDPSRIEQLSEEDCFRLKMRPLAFMTLSIQPTVDLKVWAEPNGTIHLQSMACEIRGIDYINQRFALNLKGHLSPYHNKETYLKGKADLEVIVELPLPFSLTPTPILEAAGNGLLKSVLLTIKQRLLHQLLADYCGWVSNKNEEIGSEQGAVLPSNNLIA